MQATMNSVTHIAKDPLDSRPMRCTRLMKELADLVNHKRYTTKENNFFDKSLSSY